MTDRIPRRDRLGTRLGVAFTMTAVSSVLLATVLALVTTGARIDRLVADQRDQVMASITAALAVAHERAGGWVGADLLPAHALAASAGAVLVVESRSGAVLERPPEADDFQRRLQQRGDAPSLITPTEPRGPREPVPPGQPDDVRERGRHSSATEVMAAVIFDAATTVEDPTVEIEEERLSEVVVDGQVVGTATVLFTRRDSVDPIATLGRSLSQNLLMAGLAATLLGIVVAAWVAPRVTRPLRHLTAAVRRLARGDPSARADLPAAVGELGVLARSIDLMADDLERQDRLRRALIADVAHEVRTPLSILLGEVEALQDGITEPDQQHVDSLHDEILRLARLVDDLDAIAAAEAAGFDLRRETIDLAAVASSALSGLAPQLDTNNITVDTDLTTANIRGDRRRIEQIVRNLLTNAARFCPSGGHVTLSVAPNGPHAVLEVTDDGPGIPADELPHLFERFWRGRHARGTSGSGIGLAVVAELAAAHGGEVRADNVAGRGARFTVLVPLEPLNAGSQRGVVAASSTGQPAASSVPPVPPSADDVP